MTTADSFTSLRTCSILPLKLNLNPYHQEITRLNPINATANYC